MARAADPRPRVACVLNTWFPNSHADVFISRLARRLPSERRVARAAPADREFLRGPVSRKRHGSGAGGRIRNPHLLFGCGSGAGCRWHRRDRRTRPVSAHAGSATSSIRASATSTRSRASSRSAGGRFRCSTTSTWPTSGPTREPCTTASVDEVVGTWTVPTSEIGDEPAGAECSQRDRQAGYTAGSTR